MNIIEAFKQLESRKIKRKSWGDMYIKKNLRFYIKSDTHYQLYDEPYIATANDILATDWEVME